MDKTQYEVLKWLKNHIEYCYTSKEIMRGVEDKGLPISEEAIRQACEKLIEKDKIFRYQKEGGHCFQYPEI